MFSRIAGFIRDILAAAVLGAGPVNDAFVVALKLPNLFRRLFAEGAFHVSFVPMFAGIVQAEGQNEGLRFAEQAMAALLLVLVPLTLLAELAMPWIIPVIAPGFGDDPVRLQMAVDLSRITFPYLALISLVALTGGMLNALGRFGPFAEGPILFNACLILSLVLAWALPHHVSAAPAMAWAVTISGILQLLWMVRALRQEKVSLRLVRPQMTERVKRLLALMGPGALGAGALQVNVVVDILFASFLPAGAISWLYYADRLNQLPLGVIGVAIGTTLLPMLSRQVKAGQIREVGESLNRAMEFALLLTFPAAVALCVAAHPLVTALFQRGGFGPADSAATAMALAAYAAGIPAWVLVKIFATGFFAREDTSSPVRMAVISAVFNTLLAATLVWPLQHTGLALATACSGWLQAGLLARELHKKEYLVLDSRLRHRGPRIIAAGLLAGLVLWLLSQVLAPWFGGTLWVRILALGGLVGGGACTYFGAAQVLGAFRLQDIRSLMKNRQETSAPPAV